MISPKYSSTHSYYPAAHFDNVGTPHSINLYLDYNCPYCAKIFLKFIKNVIPKLEETHAGKYQFNFVHVIQPWHPNSIYSAEIALSIAKLIRENGKGDELDNRLFWNVSESLFVNITSFYENVNSDVGRNKIYEIIYDTIAKEVDIPFSKEQVLKNIVIPQVDDPEKYKNTGNDVTVDVKYFTRYHRTVGVHVTPTVSVNGIKNDDISSGSDPEELVKIFQSHI